MSTADLDLFANPGRTLADVAAAVALGDVILDVVKYRKQTLVDDLRDLAERGAEALGSDGLTSRIDGVGQVILTAPQPKVTVSDTQAFGQWLADHEGEALGLVASRERVEVDQVEAVGCIKYLRREYLDADPQDERVEVDADTLWTLLQDGVRLVTEWLPSETAVDVLLDKRWAVVRDDGVYQLEDGGVVGDRVPGLSVKTARQSCYVKADKKAKARVAGEVRQALGLGGDDE